MRTPAQRPAHRRSRMPDRACLDALAADGLAFLAADPDRLSRFFADTGLSPADLRAAAGQPDFAASLLAHLATDQRTFVEFARETGRDPAALDVLRLALTATPPDP